MKETARAYYEAHRISFKNLATQSQKLLGTVVTLDQLKKWSTEDGGWKKPAIGADEKFKFMAEMLFERIEEEGQELAVKDLVALMNQYLTFALKAPMDLDASAKPTLDEILDTIDALDKRAN